MPVQRSRTAAHFVMPLPGSGAAATTSGVRWERLPWKLPAPKEIQVLGEGGRVLRRSPAGDTITIRCEPEAFAYRLH